MIKIMNEHENEYDFSKGERRKFYRPAIKPNIPIYLDDDAPFFVDDIASKNGIDRSLVVNDFRCDITITDVMK
jgi:hypothetical protein